MANYFDAVGLGKMGEEELKAKLTECIRDDNTFYAEDDLYARIGMGSSLVCWLAYDIIEDEMFTFQYDFHFHSDHRDRIHYCRVLRSKQDYCVVQVHLLAESVTRDIPLNLCVPLANITDMLDYGEACYAQIAAYAQEIRYWPSMEAYEKSNAENCLAAETIIPAGTFSDDEDKQSPLAYIGGKITAMERCTNSFTNEDYWHVTLSSLGTVFDVLVDAEKCKDEMAVGGILHGTFRLTAMLYCRKEDEDFLTAKKLTKEYRKRQWTPEGRLNDAGCRMNVARPVTDGILQRISTIIASLGNPADGFLTVGFADRSDGEFIQVEPITVDERKLYSIEYSCIENEEQVIRVRRYQTLEETSRILEKACRSLPEEFDFSGWLDIGYEQEPSTPDYLMHYYSGESTMTEESTPIVTGGDAFLEKMSEKTRRNHFHLVIEKGKGVELSESERNSLAAIMSYIVSVMAVCGIDPDGMQIGVCNDPDGELLWKQDEEYKDRYHISLCADTPDDWSQTIYQLGYVFTHCILDYEYGTIPSAWMEETICEMMQIWLLTSFANNWEQCELSKKDPNYDVYLRDYLHDYMMGQDWVDKPAQCTTMKKLLAMNDHAEEHSADRVATVIHLYYLTMPGDIFALLDTGYYTLGENSGLVDTKSWLRANPNSIAVQYLASLQDHAVYKDARFKEFLLSIGEDPENYWNRSDDDDDLNA